MERVFNALFQCFIFGRYTGVCSYVQKHVIDALEGFSQFLANEVSSLRSQETGKSLLEHQ